MTEPKPNEPNLWHDAKALRKHLEQHPEIAGVLEEANSRAHLKRLKEMMKGTPQVSAFAPAIHALAVSSRKRTYIAIEPDGWFTRLVGRIHSWLMRKKHKEVKPGEPRNCIVDELE